MFTKIVVPLDGSVIAEQAIGFAASIARASRAPLSLVLVHKPIPFGGFDDAPWNVEELTSEEAYVDALRQEVTAGASVSVTCAVLRGEPSEQIRALVRSSGADLIVMTTHGRTGFSRAWLGSVAHSVLRHSGVPVFMLRPNARRAPAQRGARLPRQILVTLDGSALATAILAPAISLARCAHARLTLLRVVEPIPLPVADLGLPIGYPTLAVDESATGHIVAETKRELDGVAEGIQRGGFTDIEQDVVVANNVAAAILDYARTHGMTAIAMATHGRGVSRLFMGSVADKVLRASGLPMLLERPLAVERAPTAVPAVERNTLPADEMTSITP